MLCRNELVTFPELFTVWCCECYTGESTFEVKIEIETEADVSDDKPRPYLCTVCDKRFKGKRQLNVHKGIHTGEIHTCSRCDKTFSSQSTLCRHMNIHTSKYKCSVCGKCCVSSRELAVHRRSHSGEKLFECTVCNKRFTRSGYLVVHSRIHSREKPYIRYICDKAFSQSSYLNTHIRVHTGDKPYKCSLCNKSFTEPSSLQQHKRRAHSNSRPYECFFVGNCLRQTRNWSNMFVFTTMQSRTHVDTVLVVLHGLNNSRHICWSHTMKVLGSLVTFVRRNLPSKATLSSTYFDMKMWSRMFAVNVHWVSVQQLNCCIICQCTLGLAEFSCITGTLFLISLCATSLQIALRHSTSPRHSRSPPMSKSVGVSGLLQRRRWSFRQRATQHSVTAPSRWRLHVPGTLCLRRPDRRPHCSRFAGLSRRRCSRQHLLTLTLTACFRCN